MATAGEHTGFVEEPPCLGPVPGPRTTPQRTRPYAVVAGVLFLVATAASLLSQPFLAPVNGPDPLVSVAAHPAQVGTGVLLGLVAGLASTGIAVALYPVLRTSHEGLALGAVAFRVVEGVLALGAATTLLAVVSLSRQPAGSGDRAAAQALLAEHHALADVGLVVAFSLGALLYYLAFFANRRIPRWLSGWGIVGVVVLLVSVVLVVYGVIGPLSTTQVVLAAPIGIQELVLAVWLLAKGLPEPTAHRGPIRRPRR